MLFSIDFMFVVLAQPGS